MSKANKIKEENKKRLEEKKKQDAEIKQKYKESLEGDDQEILEPNQVVPIIVFKKPEEAPKEFKTKKEEYKERKKEKINKLREQDQKRIEKEIEIIEKRENQDEEFVDDEETILEPKIVPKEIKPIKKQKGKFEIPLTTGRVVDEKAEKIHTAKLIEEVDRKEMLYFINKRKLEPKKPVEKTIKQRVENKSLFERINDVYLTSFKKEHLKEVLQDVELGTDLFAYYTEFGSKGCDPTAWKYIKKEDRQAEGELKKMFKSFRNFHHGLSTLPSVPHGLTKKISINQKTFVETIKPEFYALYKNIKPLIEGPEHLESFSVTATVDGPMFEMLMREQDITNQNFEQEVLQDGKIKYTINAPQLDITGLRTRKYVYSVRYKNVSYNLRFQQYLMDYNNYLLMRTVSEAEENDAFNVIFKTILELRGVASNYFYGNGSLEGQMGRFEKCYQISTFNPPSITNKGGVPIDSDSKKLFYTWIYKAWGLKKPEIKFDTPNVTIINDRFREATGSGAIIINNKANAGICWEEGTKRKDVFIQDLLLSSLLIRDCENYEKLEFRQRWDFTFVAKMKPKDEVTPMEDLHTKTRNFWEFCSFVFIGLQMLLCNMFKGAKTFEFQSPNRNLNGWSAMKGGGDLIYKFIIEFYKSDKVWDYLVYCDNVYLVVKLKTGVYWISLDVQKAEASQSEYNIWDFLNFVKVAHLKTETINKQWEGYLDYLYVLLTNYRCLFLANQIPGFGIPSGTMGTGYMNQFKTFNFLYHFILTGAVPVEEIKSGEVKFSKAWDQQVFDRRSQFKTVAVTDITTICNGTAKHMEVFGFDLLGYDMLYFKYKTNLTLVSVIDRKRLVPTMCFFRPDYRGKLGEEPITPVDAMLLDFVKTRCLYIIGGWCYNGLSGILRGYSNHLMKNLKKHVQNRLELDNLASIMTQTGLEDFVNPEQLESSARYLTVGSTPTISDALYICAGETVSEAFINDILEDKSNLKYLNKFINAFDAAVLLGEDRITPDVFVKLYASTTMEIDYIPILIGEEKRFDIPKMQIEVSELRRMATEIWKGGKDYKNRTVLEEVDIDPMKGQKFAKKKVEDVNAAMETVKEYIKLLDTGEFKIVPWNTPTKSKVPIKSYVGMLYKQCLVYVANYLSLPHTIVKRVMRKIKPEWIDLNALQVFIKMAFDSYKKDEKFNNYYVTSNPFAELKMSNAYKDLLYLDKWEREHFTPTKSFKLRGQKVTTEGINTINEDQESWGNRSEEDNDFLLKPPEFMQNK